MKFGKINIYQLSFFFCSNFSSSFFLPFFLGDENLVKWKFLQNLLEMIFDWMGKVHFLKKL
jgi:hypothetical protein